MVPWVTSDPDFKVTTFFEVEYLEKRRVLKTKLLLHKRKLHMEWYYVWWPWLTSKRVVRVCQHQLSFLFLILRLRCGGPPLHWMLPACLKLVLVLFCRLFLCNGNLLNRLICDRFRRTSKTTWSRSWGYFSGLTKRPSLDIWLAWVVQHQLRHRRYDVGF